MAVVLLGLGSTANQFVADLTTATASNCDAPPPPAPPIDGALGTVGPTPGQFVDKIGESARSRAIRFGSVLKKGILGAGGFSKPLKNL